MNTAEIQKQIMQVKKQNGIYILAHSYQSDEILEIADFAGDSYALSLAAEKTDAKNVLMCGVRFMAETVKIMSPDKRVWLANPQAGCPMAEQLDVSLINGLKQMHPDAVVVAYINTTAELKTVCDVIVTSSTAVETVRKLPQKKSLFIPDCNLGAYVQSRVPEKEIITVHGGCPIHARVTEAEAVKAKNAHPNAVFAVHPECVPAVVKLADYVGSTSGIVKYAEETGFEEYIIGTEVSIVSHLKYAQQGRGGKRFYPLSKDLICPNMKMTTLPDVLNYINSGEEILLPDEIMRGAKRAVDTLKTV